MDQMKLQGVYTAIITPFTNSGALDLPGLKKNLQHQTDGGVAGLVPLGTTGETPTLTDDEELQILKTTIDHAKNCGRKVQVIVGAGSNSTLKTIEKSKKAESMGADAVMIVTPYYNKPTQTGIMKHFEAVSSAISIPFLVYNIPGRTGTLIETATLTKIAQLKGAIGVKEATGNVSNMSDVLETIPRINPVFQVLSGDDGLTLPLLSLGGCGVISVASNVAPKMMTDFVNAWLRGDVQAAKEWHFKLSPLFKALFIESNPGPAKAAMNLLGLAAGEPRLPLVAASGQTRERLAMCLQDLALLAKGSA
jgi:4-hydroxy-tetrahydrodipicolinate synthase